MTVSEYNEKTGRFDTVVCINARGMGTIKSVNKQIGAENTHPIRSLLIGTVTTIAILGVIVLGWFLGSLIS